MTTEDDFQRALDANPEDHNTRLVFADWLQEHDDPRADGYRALASDRYVTDPVTTPGTWIWWRYYDGVRDHECEDWWALIEGGDPIGGADPYGTSFPSRREAEDAAALAFAKLPKRRAALLAVKPDEAVRKPRTRKKPAAKPKSKKKK